MNLVLLEVEIIKYKLKWLLMSKKPLGNHLE